jgi:hypothetical protein
MDTTLLNKHISKYIKSMEADKAAHELDKSERAERAAYYQSWTAEKLESMTEEQFYEFMAKLWAMLIWGNKKYVIDKLISDNSFPTLKEELSKLLWDKDPIEKRWDHFRSMVKGMGPAMMSEILCHVHPDRCMLWNRRAYVGFNYLGVQKLPKYDYQLTGKKYKELSQTADVIAKALIAQDLKDANLLTVDYFIWHELQVEGNLSQIHKKGHGGDKKPAIDATDAKTADFIHNEIRDKLVDIGQWLGFESKKEIRVATGSQVDAIWEATIGNMGRVIYVFEVQTRGSIDSLLMNLLRSLKNPAVQGIVAVTDVAQIDTLRKHSADVSGLKEKLRFWDYQEVMSVHVALESVNEVINRLGLVPEGFWK